MRKSLYPSILALVAILTFGAVPKVAHALTITPIRYEISGNPGQELDETMTLINETKSSQVYYASFANFAAQGETGSPTFIDATDDLGTWITTDVASINLKAGEERVVPFHIKIPKDAEPGGHFAALFWGTTPGGSSNQVSIGSKTGLLILLSVSGDVKKEAGLLDFGLHDNKHFYKMLPVGFQYRFSNQGGDRVKPIGSVVVRSILGWRVAKVNANTFDGNVLPGTTRKFLPEWAKRDSVDVRDQQALQKTPYSFKQSVSDEWHNFAVGIFRANVDVAYGTPAQEIKSKSVYFAVFPWELMLIIIPGLFILYIILRTMLRSYNRSVIRKAHARFQAQKEL